MISLITCTGDRPECFARQERWMDRQTFRLSPPWHFEWIVIDDGRDPTAPTRGQNYRRLPPKPDHRESFAENLRAGLAAATGEYIFIIEDDDWYAPHHIERLFSRLGDFDLVGESRAKYYNVAHRRYRQLNNRNHASLCQSAFHRKLIPLVLANLDTTFVDMRLWAQATSKFLFPESESCVGLKGQKGRKGIGMGHHPRENWGHDPDGRVLRSWIGADADEVLA